MTVNGKPKFDYLKLLLIIISILSFLGPILVPSIIIFSIDDPDYYIEVLIGLLLPVLIVMTGPIVVSWNSYKKGKRKKSASWLTITFIISVLLSFFNFVLGAMISILCII